jgi:hypothetical protein
MGVRTGVRTGDRTGVRTGDRVDVYRAVRRDDRRSLVFELSPNDLHMMWTPKHIGNITHCNDL